jgi:hypothetical protein
MSPRARKFIGMFGILAFLAAYVVAVAAMAEHVPPRWPAELVFYLVAGVAWGLPVFPLISWMNRGR